MIVSEVKPYRGHSKDIASHLVVALPRLAASDGIATCLVLVSPIHVPALVRSHSHWLSPSRMLRTWLCTTPTQSQARSSPSWHRLPQCRHSHHLWLTQLTALLVCALFLTGHLSEEERDVVFFYPCFILFPRHSKPHHCPSSAPLSTPPQRSFKVTPIGSVSSALREALLIYEVPWTKLPTLALHTSPSLPLSGTPTPSHTSLALADNDVLIHSPPAFDHAHSLFQGRASSRLVLPGPCPSTPRLLRIAHITCPFQDVKIMAHPLPLSLATHKTPLGITRSVALTVGGFVLSQRPVAIVYPSYLCVLIPEVWPYHGYSKDQVRRSRLVIPPALVSFPPPVSLPLQTRPSSLPSVTPAGYPPPTNSHGLGSVHHAPVLEQERRFGDVRLTPSRLATPSDIGSS
ncbi:hypothetical protein EDB89DRAFT_2064417 [Lactarius sanguifluus]|nr:hypothetical protein EDB89DRAFT_2064417 [Lactarius sanguifluus]